MPIACLYERGPGCESVRSPLPYTYPRLDVSPWSSAGSRSCPRAPGGSLHDLHGGVGHADAPLGYLTVNCRASHMRREALMRANQRANARRFQPNRGAKLMKRLYVQVAVERHAL
jgi:hypothetical protein